MKKKLLGIFVCMLLIATVLPASATFTTCTVTVGNDVTNEEIFIEIEGAKSKILSVDEIIGNIHVKYWEHVIDDAVVKNDYILLHMDPENDNILKFECTWSDIEFSFLDPIEEIFEPENYFWKQIVIFNDENDCTHFYKFSDPQEYPVVCWEVRHKDGATILYSLSGDPIGYGIPAPGDGFSLSGYNNASWPDPWIEFRQNADSWFSKWCNTTTSLSLPTPATISSHVSNSGVTLFYELAHGNQWYFQGDSAGSYYYSSVTGYNVQSDMANRQPITFAFIGSCQGMTTTGAGTFSYEFRKGQMINTTTVGYDHMETCPGWQYAFQWQDYMFQKINRGNTVKASFDMADAQYPTISPATVFVGDINLKAKSSQIDSEINPIQKVENKAFNFDLGLLEWLFERFPNAFPILRHMLGL